MLWILPSFKSHRVEPYGGARSFVDVSFFTSFVHNDKIEVLCDTIDLILSSIFAWSSPFICSFRSALFHKTFETWTKLNVGRSDGRWTAVDGNRSDRIAINGSGLY